MNATFSPLDPKKCLEIIRTHSCFGLAGKNITEAKTTLTTTRPVGFKDTSLATDVKGKLYRPKEDIK